MELSLGTNDLLSHVIKIGIDTYPQINIAIEQTKLSVFADEARNRWPQLFNRLEASSTEFVMHKVVRQTDTQPPVTHPTLALSPRGPIFICPLLAPPPVGPTGFDEDEYMELFPDLRDTFLRSVGGPDCLRIGLVRELIFDTGQARCFEILTSSTTFQEAELIGAKGIHVFRDKECNVRITVDTVEIGRATQLPVGKTVTEQHAHGLAVSLDVNNHRLRALEETDIENVLTRARGFWPEQLLQYLNSLGDSI